MQLPATEYKKKFCMVRVYTIKTFKDKSSGFYYVSSAVQWYDTDKYCANYRIGIHVHVYSGSLCEVH